MRDIPFFATEYGVAGLTLSEIPYKGCAYIRLQSSMEPELLLRECIDFCRAAGATRIYATGHSVLEKYPPYTELWEMTRLREGMDETNASLVPVSMDTANMWRAYYNERMANVPNAATMTELKMQELLKKGAAYYVYKENVLIGVGSVSEGRIDSVVSLQKGCGKDVLLALNRVLSGARVSVEVASVNTKAVALYQRLGFVTMQVISKWYKIL